MFQLRLDFVPSNKAGSFAMDLLTLATPEAALGVVVFLSYSFLGVGRAETAPE
jgi:hypothetical protein